MSIKIDPTIFRDYDIRGTYPDQINKEIYFVLGQAIASYLKLSTIAVGYDMRLSSKELFRGFSQGIISLGTDVINLGEISTEMHNFASGKFLYPANIIITASHNPGNYNGLKIVKKGVVALHGQFGLPEIKKLAIKQDFKLSHKKGKIQKKEIFKEWIDHALSFIEINKLKKLKVAVDAGNGMGGVSWQAASKHLPISLIPLYFTPDGSFPNHLPDPLKLENIVSLKKTITSLRCDIGFALDGDADRLFVLDEKANVLSGTVTTALLSDILLEKYGPDTILYNAVCGKIVPEIIKQQGGKAIKTRVGHSYIKEKMKKYQALFAGEHSGHFYFRNNYFAESSLITGLIILEYLSRKNTKLSVLVKKYNKYYASPEINFHIDNRENILNLLEKKFQDARSTDNIDGLSIYYSNFWFNVRCSKTEPLLRLNVEADNPVILKKKIKLLSDLINGVISKDTGKI